MAVRLQRVKQKRYDIVLSSCNDNNTIVLCVNFNNLFYYTISHMCYGRHFILT